jgi:response regulator RpfG family c-di-GMP phosphodiesterase
MIEIAKSCLLISNDPLDQAIFMEALLDVAPETHFMLSGDSMEALQILQEDNLTPDCVFVELSEPGIDAVQFLKGLKKIQLLRYIPVIVHASVPALHRVIELQEIGARAIYFRPYNYLGVCNVLNLYFKQDYINNLN